MGGRHDRRRLSDDIGRAGGNCLHQRPAWEAIMTLATDLFHRSQTRRRLAHSYPAWAKEDLKAGRLERCARYAQNFHELMYGARLDLYHMRAWGKYAPKPKRVWLEAAE